MTGAPPKPIRFGDLGVRLASGLVLACVALADVWMGGLWALALVILLVVLMMWELHRMVTGDGRTPAPAFLLLAAAAALGAVLSVYAGIGAGVAAMLAGAVAVLVLVRPGGAFLAGGLVYVGVPMSALLVFRSDATDGFAIILWLVLVVVAADIGAYFVGRTIGGAKLWARVSPGKTRSGALGGLAFAGLTGVVFSLAAGWNPSRTGALSVGVALASQAGDLLESAVKRRFGVKDSSQLIPGHGGVLDRLDALIGGVWFYGVCALAGVTVNGA